MPKWIHRIKIAFVGSPLFKHAFLAVAPLFAKPHDFVPKPNVARPRYTRHRWLLGLPLLPAGLFTSSFIGLMNWMGLRQQAIAPMPDAALNTYLSVLTYAAWSTTACVVGVIYLVAGYRWMINAVLVAAFNRGGAKALDPPFAFFLLGTSSVALWFAALSWGICSLMRHFGPNFQPAVDTFASSHPYLFMGALCVAGLGIRVAQDNTSEGMLAMFGGSERNAFIASTVKLVVTLAVLGAALGVASLI